jgi:small subunit ribosomal protein S17
MAETPENENIEETEATTPAPEAAAEESTPAPEAESEAATADEAEEAAAEDTVGEDEPEAEAAPEPEPEPKKQPGPPPKPPRSVEERVAERTAARAQKAAARTRRRTRAKEKRAADTRETKPPLTAEPSTGRQKVRQGIVTSAKADKTITVRIDTARRHKRYEKIVRSSSTLHAHDEANDANAGDIVRITESRPLSRLKRWRLVDVVERAK